MEGEDIDKEQSVPKLWTIKRRKEIEMNSNENKKEKGFSLSDLAAFLLIPWLLTMLILVFFTSLGCLFWLIWNAMALFTEIPATPIQNFLPFVIVKNFENIYIFIAVVFYSFILGLVWVIKNMRNEVHHD